MKPRHRELPVGRWYGLNLMQQLARVGKEVNLALKWQEKGKPELCLRSADLALALLGLTIDDPENQDRVRELTQVRELLADYFFGENLCRTSPDLWRGWFDVFARAARKAGTRLRGSGPVQPG
jgi:hypothetical protein